MRSHRQGGQERLFFLRRLMKFGMDSVILTNFYRCTIENILTGCITVWYGSCTVRDHKVVVRSAEIIISRGLPALQDTYHTRCLRKACRILKDCYHNILQTFNSAVIWQAIPEHSVSNTKTGEQFLSELYSLATLHSDTFNYCLPYMFSICLVIVLYI